MSKAKAQNSNALKHASHPFPDIKGNISKVGKESDGTGSPFRPMFNNRDSKKTPAWPGSKTTQQPTIEDTLEQAKNRGIERGIAAGQLEACKMVQSELSPIIDDLKRKLKQCNKVQMELSEIYSNNSLKLVMSIVEKIAGSDAFLNKKDLISTQAVIQKAMQELFDLDLYFNPQDYQYIESLSACENNFKWNQYMEVEIKKDDTLNAGIVNCLPRQQDWDAIYKQVETLLDEIMVVEE